jgi:hypothetical protein
MILITQSIPFINIVITKNNIALQIINKCTKNPNLGLESEGDNFIFL